MSTDAQAPAETPSWIPDEGDREIEARKIALVAGQETAATAASWWSEAAATIATIRELAPRNLPRTPDSWEEWFDLHKIRTHVDVDEVLTYLDQIVAACDSIAGDYRREGRRLVREKRAADDAVEAGRSVAPDAGTIGE